MQKNNIIKTNNSVRIMGILNANEDSFFKGSRFQNEDAILKIKEMIKNGANIIDLGGVSSRPGSIPVFWKEELKRVKPIIDLIYKENLYKEIDFSLDSYSPEVLKYGLDRGFNIINDITGLQNNEVCKIAASYKVPVVIMHMQNNPKNMQEKPLYNDIIFDIDNFFKERINKAKSFGIEEIILDVGIGFGKTLEHNLKLIKNLEYFKHFGYEILMGASRKSMIDKITPTKIEDRLPGTLAIHLESIKNGASIIRCHDVKEHFQAIKVQESILNI